MTDTLFDFQVSFPAKSAITADSVVNNWHIMGDNAGGTWIPSNAIVGLAVFYDTFKIYRSPRIRWESAEVKVYRMGDTKPRAPIYHGPLGVSNTAATTPLPSELAICLSYAAVPVSGEPARRKRGRVYLGPWGPNAIEGTDNGYPTASLLALIKGAADALLTTSTSDGTYQWCQVSNATGTPVCNPVVSGWVDNAWDIQRRRGVDPTARLVFPTV